MTLVAAFRLHDTPALIGDFLLSWDDGSVAGLRKKVCIINQNLAVAWTGSLRYAEIALRYLKDNAHVELSKANLENILANIPEPEDTSIQLSIIGWLVTDKPRAFRWSCKIPHKINFSEPQYQGTGRLECQRVLGEKGPIVKRLSRILCNWRIYTFTRSSPNTINN
ncbi:hypothetical protein EV696_104255 [Permianibacter aggregans]|uniref:Uncharacterized protein n=1 Tax=Permianibacter aggregans TaxID=1510150 RepID=A0A4R6UUG9_9GAMM|nr:hypothetical protein EV696_104255 [Permianibacter aggregans]